MVYSAYLTCEKIEMEAIVFFFYYYHYDEEQKQQIIDMHQKMLEDVQLRSEEQLMSGYHLFRERFNPNMLHALDGEELIETMFNMMNRDSLVYWLEFKNDELFDTMQYGSIAGGSSYKYGIFKRNADQKWVTVQGKQVLSIKEAIRMGTNIRDAILRGASYIAQMDNASEDAYLRLQKQLDSEREFGVERYGWIHKYYHMIFPDQIDSFHSTGYQQHALLCSGIKPVSKDQLYILTGQLMEIIRELPMLPCHAVQAIRHTYGPPVNYYRIGTRSGSTKRSVWSQMRRGEYISIGWEKLGDLRAYAAENDSATKEQIKLALESLYPNVKQTMSRETNEICRFFLSIKENDILVACDGETLLGIGRVTGSYEYLGNLEFPHTRRVEWLYIRETALPNRKEGLRTTVTQYKDFDNMLEIRKLAASGEKEPEAKDNEPEVKAAPLPPLPEDIRRIGKILERKMQVILYGPPGTGKTYHAERVAREFAARGRFNKTFDKLNEVERDCIIGDGKQSGFVRTCCFHPSYGYEDFIEGIKPRVQDGSTVFELKDGLFKQLCKQALEQPEYGFFCIVDEINRGDISRIFGELITLLEADKRGKTISLPVSGEAFCVPSNVHIIGTMNTADRSIAMLDVALRRRFGFKELLPDYTLLEGVCFGTLPLDEWVRQLNQRICRSLGRDARNLQIGHSYFMEKEKAITSPRRFAQILAEDVLPLIEEYCYGDYAKMAEILGTALVDVERQTLKYQLFEGDIKELENALLQPCPDIQIIDSIESNTESDGEDDSDGESEA